MDIDQELADSIAIAMLMNRSGHIRAEDIALCSASILVYHASGTVPAEAIAAWHDSSCERTRDRFCSLVYNEVYDATEWYWYQGDRREVTIAMLLEYLIAQQAVAC